MSETKKVSLHTIPVDSLVEIKVSGQFHKRLVGLYFNMVKKLDEEKFNELSGYLVRKELDKITNEQDLIDATSFETILILLTELETAFQKKGVITLEEIEVPDDQNQKS